MNKQELIRTVAARTGLTHGQVKAALEATTATIAETSALGQTVQIIGFGTFGGREIAATTRRNPHTGEPIACVAKRAPFFKAGAVLKATVAGQVTVKTGSRA